MVPTVTICIERPQSPPLLQFPNEKKIRDYLESRIGNSFKRPEQRETCLKIVAIVAKTFNNLCISSGKITGIVIELLNSDTFIQPLVESSEPSIAILRQIWIPYLSCWLTECTTEESCSNSNQELP